jgi:Na+-transporting NADH:ubiquinone oxidoreductase subunit C
MSDRLKSVLFAVVLCFVCSMLLTAASSGLKHIQHKNMAVDRQKNILLSVSLIEPEKTYPSNVIEKMYETFIRSVNVDSSGRILGAFEPPDSDALPIYLFVKDDQIEGYIVPIDSRGLWGRIRGYLAIEKDGSTISGFTVYQHSETPGLGGEIEQNWFQKNFIGKKIVDRSGEFVSIAIAKGPVQDRIAPERQINYVDGISGATLTGKFLSAGLRETLAAYEPMSVRFRKNQIKGTTFEPDQNPDL